MQRIHRSINVPHLLSKVESNIILGYTHENFRETRRILQTLGTCMNYADLEVVEQFWRDSYTDSCDAELLASTVRNLKYQYQHTK